MSDYSAAPITHEQVIFDFYNFQNEKNFQKSFDCMTPELQNRPIWKGDFNTFAKGYAYTVNIANVKCTEIANDVGITLFEVTYDDHIKEMHHPLTDKLKEVGKDNEHAPALIGQFNEFMINELGAAPDAVSAIAQDNYFEHNSTELCLYLAKADYIGRDELFTFTPAMSEQTRLITVIDTDTKNKPRISNIRRKPAPIHN